MLPSVSCIFFRARAAEIAGILPPPPCFLDLFVFATFSLFLFVLAVKGLGKTWGNFATIFFNNFSLDGGYITAIKLQLSLNFRLRIGGFISLN